MASLIRFARWSRMSPHQPLGSLDNVAQKWRDLAERRRVHFVDLFESGRWRHYYGEEQFLQRMREAIRLSERWAMIAPPLAEEPTAAVGEAATVVEVMYETAPIIDASATVIVELVADIPRRSAA